ncbi:hypothetical protein [Streptomyces himalayensis]|uniref:hypothetical protein n=1 Tax=Streptomyces himalayensis TaxID=2820085 RepID=UPI002867C61A|nr:hypothetical protein [Streptomyces himalayensis]
MARRTVAWVASIVLFVEAGGVALLNWFLGHVVDRQDMSLAGLDPHAMSVSAWIAGGVFGLYLALCGLAALLPALRGRAPAGFGRVLLISAAVVHAVLGAFVVGLVGWGAFAFMMLVLGLIVLTLMAYDGQAGDGARPAAPAGPRSSQDAAPGGGGVSPESGAPGGGALRNGPSGSAAPQPA